MSEAPTILITGGAQRMGLHCARRLIEDGYRVIVTCRRIRRGWLEKSREGIEVIQADFSTLEGIDRFIEDIKSRGKFLRAIIHNASLWMDDQEGSGSFQAMFMVHMQAPYMINMACKDLFVPGQAADIIHMTDYVAWCGSGKHVAYSATKAGLENMTQSFAKLLAPAIKVNSIAPFLIMFNEEDSEEYKARVLAKSALGFEPGPGVAYQAVKYLLDNVYVTGECLQLNGGRHLR